MAPALNAPRELPPPQNMLNVRIPSGHQVQSEQVRDPLSQALLAQHDVQLAAGGNLL